MDYKGGQNVAIRGKNINLFLMDGIPNGRIKCTLTNWTGIAYKIPRTEIDKCKDRGDLSQSGVYFLFGTSDLTGENSVYIGQAGSRKNGEGILNRLLEHKRNPDKDYWTEAVIFTTSNNSLGQTEISFLENRFCNLATQSQRYIVKNMNEPTSGNITEEKESELEEFIEYALMIMGALGHKVFLPIIERSKPLLNESHTQETACDEPLFYYSRSSGIAEGRPTREGFVVLAGSVLAKQLKQSCPENVRRFRERHADFIDENGILSIDVLLTSPSAAASFVGGSSLSGNLNWKTSEGKTLKDIDEHDNI